MKKTILKWMNAYTIPLNKFINKTNGNAIMQNARNNSKIVGYFFYKQNYENCHYFFCVFMFYTLINHYWPWHIVFSILWLIQETMLNENVFSDFLTGTVRWWWCYHVLYLSAIDQLKLYNWCFCCFCCYCWRGGSEWNKFIEMGW